MFSSVLICVISLSEEIVYLVSFYSFFNMVLQFQVMARLNSNSQYNQASHRKSDVMRERVVIQLQQKSNQWPSVKNKKKKLIIKIRQVVFYVLIVNKSTKI